MIAAGLPSTRVSAASYGEHKPVGANETAEGKAANRRIELGVVPDLSNLPGFDELKAAGSMDAGDRDRLPLGPAEDIVGIATAMTTSLGRPLNFPAPDGAARSTWPGGASVPVRRGAARGR